MEHAMLACATNPTNSAALSTVASPEQRATRMRVRSVHAQAAFTASAQLPPDAEEVAAHQAGRANAVRQVTRMYVNEEGRLVSRSVKLARE